MKDNLGKIETALFQIHALAKIFEEKEMEGPKAPSPNNRYSAEYLSVFQIIAEKAKFCLEIIDDMEVTA